RAGACARRSRACLRVAQGAGAPWRRERQPDGRGRARGRGKVMTELEQPVNDDRTRLQHREDDRTRLQTREAEHADATRPTSASRAATGSDWSNPEIWTAGDDVPIGPGSVIKERFEL